MRKLLYVGAGLLVAFTSYLAYNIPKTNENPKPNELETLVNDNSRINLGSTSKTEIKNNQRVVNYSTGIPIKISLINKNKVYGNLRYQNLDEIAEVLSDDCKDSCTYYADEKGNVYKADEPQHSFYDIDNNCLGLVVNDGWVLLNHNGIIEKYGRNNSDEVPSSVDDMLKFECD